MAETERKVLNTAKLGMGDGGGSCEWNITRNRTDQNGRRGGGGEAGAKKG